MSRRVWSGKSRPLTPVQPIDFVALAAALLDRAETLLPQWLPGGVRKGREWVCGDLSGNAGGSLSVNMVTGAWKDFAAGDSGGDLTSLYAAIHGLNNAKAATELRAQLGWQEPQRTAAQSAPVGPPAADAATPPGKRRTMWRAVTPVPDLAPPPDFKHWHYSEPESTWEYRFEGALYGYVARFRNSTGGKEVMPFTWCVDESDGRGTQRWHWKQWEVPRPLYVPSTVLSADCSLPVVLVEGEKCALAGHTLLPGDFDWVSWPGGGQAWDKAAWGWLMGRTVYLWPDCDAKRVPLTKAEREAGVDPETKPLLPAAKQPGVRAMQQIGAVLQAQYLCTVFMCRVPEPGAVADGWDVADAVQQGWGPEEVRALVRGAVAFVPDGQAPDGAAAAEGISTPGLAGAGKGSGEHSDDLRPTWRDSLLRSGGGKVLPVRDNLVLALEGVPGSGLPGVEGAAGLVAYNEFTNNVEKTRPTPWGSPAGEWDEVDELEMGTWLAREHWLPSMSRATLEEAVAMVAKRHRFHPVRDAMARLKGTWDGQKRLGTWLQVCCMQPGEADPLLAQYLARVGTWLVMAICARVLTPGCKFDYMTIFEGPQGWGKSTLARLLALDWFADTGLVLGDKDSYQNLQGVLVYEWGELDGLNRSEVTKVKLFISSPKDRFRASFDRRAKDYPRQVVFVGTTNEDHYLTDPTGNRRMWPVRLTKQVDTEWFRAHRDQLFAEALACLENGDRFHPTQREQRELFDPQQQQRQVESAIQAACLRYLYDQDQRVSGMHENGALVNEITAPELLSRLGISVDKQTHVLLRQVTAALRVAGWVRFRSSRADRPWMFRRPDGAAGFVAGASGGSTVPTQGTATTEADSVCPF